jgi:hypothetical protein
MTLNAAQDMGEGEFFGWCPRCQATTKVKINPPSEDACNTPPLLPITQVDPQWQRAMDDLTDEKASLALVLHDIVMEWESLERQGIYYGRLAAIMTRARFVLGNLDKVEV